MSLALLSAGAFVAAASATILAGPRRFMRGSHISQVVVRRAGYWRALIARQCLVWGGIPFALLGHHVPYVVLTSAVALWALDDWLFPDDDDRKKRYRWAKVRLRMPKPIKLRIVERWVPA